MKMTRNLHRDLKLQNIFFYIVLLAALILLGYLSKTYKFEVDWTLNNRNTLTETTQTILDKLEQPLTFIAYIPDDPILQQELIALVSKYQRFKTDSRIEFINPDLQPAKAKNAGITYTGQVILQLGDKTETLTAIDEQTIMQALSRLSRTKQSIITFLAGHKEHDPFSSQSTGISTLSDVLRRQGFIVKSHKLMSTQAIPADNDILVLASPQQAYLAGEISLIKDYISQGGKLLWLHDPDSSDSLTPLADHLGILIHTGTIVDANQELQQLLGIQSPAVIPVIDYSDFPVSQGIDQHTLFPFSTLIEEDFDPKVKEVVTWQYTAFLNTMPSSWLETGDLNQSTLLFETEHDDKPGPLPLALALTKNIDSEVDDNVDQAVNMDAQQPEAQQRIIIIGDSDFLLNAFIGYGANLDLAKNIFNWLSQEDDFLNLPSQISPDLHLDLSDNLLISLSFFFLILLPLALLIMGILIWSRRRKS